MASPLSIPGAAIQKSTDYDQLEEKRELAIKGLKSIKTLLGENLHFERRDQDSTKQKPKKEDAVLSSIFSQERYCDPAPCF